MFPKQIFLYLISKSKTLSIRLSDYYKREKKIGLISGGTFGTHQRLKHFCRQTYRKKISHHPVFRDDPAICKTRVAPVPQKDHSPIQTKRYRHHHLRCHHLPPPRHLLHHHLRSRRNCPQTWLANPCAFALRVIPPRRSNGLRNLGPIVAVRPTQGFKLCYTRKDFFQEIAFGAECVQLTVNWIEQLKLTLRACQHFLALKTDIIPLFF